MNAGREVEFGGRRRASFLLLAMVAVSVRFAVGVAHGADTSSPAGGAPPRALGFFFTVTSTGDGANTGSGAVCDDGTGHCTLRAALEASNAVASADTIGFDIPTSDPGYDPASGRFTIELTGALPDVTDPVTIQGPGANVLTVDRDTGGDYHILNVDTAGTVTVSGLTISDGNVTGAFGRGGGIENVAAGTLNVVDCALVGNNSETRGGGISNEVSGTLNVIRCTFEENGAGSGGAISASGTVNVVDSTFSGNHADFGGAVFNSDGIANVTNCTIAGNHASASGSDRGGGIYNDDVSHPVSVKSSIIAGNLSSVPDVFGPFHSLGFNLIGDTEGSSGFTAASDLTGTHATHLDPQLDPNGLRDNGGTTRTIALLPGSPAIDHGTSAGIGGTLADDQRGPGFARAVDDPGVAAAIGGDGADIGAFELQPNLDEFLSYAVKTAKGTAPFFGVGPVTLTDALGTGGYDVATAATLALPAALDGADRKDAGTHLLEYHLKPVKGAPKTTPRLDVRVQNACSNMFLTVKQPLSLLVPTAQDLANPVTPPVESHHHVDHFLCRQVKVERKLANGTALPKFLKGIQIDVIDQFQSRRYDLNGITKLCLPTSKAGSPVVLKGPLKNTPVSLTPAGIRQPGTALVCYSVKLARTTIMQNGCGPADPTSKGTKIVPPQAAHVPHLGMFTANQLGTLRLDSGKEHEVCLATLLTLP